MDDYANVPVSATRRVAIGIGARIAAFAALVAAGAGLMPVETASGRKRKKKKPAIVRRFAPNMVGTNEVPSTSGDPNGLGSAVFDIKNNGRTICCRFNVGSLSPDSVVILTHIHQGGAGVDGPVKVDFHGHLNKCVPVPVGLSNQIKARPANFYANLHTNFFPDGAIRGQLRLRPGS